MTVSGPTVIVHDQTTYPKDMIHIAFWADKHHKVRVFPGNLAIQDWWAGSSRWSDDPLFLDGGEIDRHLARYCQHLEATLFPGSYVVYSFEPAPERQQSYTVLEKDKEEYLAWCIDKSEDICLV